MRCRWQCGCRAKAAWSRRWASALLVTHQVNISALAQAFVAMGEGLVVSVDGANVNIAGRLNLGA